MDVNVADAIGCSVFGLIRTKRGLHTFHIYEEDVKTYSFCFLTA